MASDGDGIVGGMKLRLIVLLACAVVASGLWLALRNRPAETAPDAPAALITLTGNTMGGTWSVKLPALPRGTSEAQLSGSVRSLLDRLEQQMSDWRADSDVSRFNRYGATEWFAVPSELADVVDAATQASEETGGAFDITVSPLVRLWGFGPGADPANFTPPSDEKVAATRALVGYQKIECRREAPALRKRDPRVTIDLGGIGKGFAADRVGALLDSQGAADYLIAIGGELRARGHLHPNVAWPVGIETPTPDLRRVLVQLPLVNASLSTSGDYRNFRVVAGKRLCHEIDARTARPADSGLASVSVIDRSGARADALATALFVLGPEEGCQFARRRGVAALFIVRGESGFAQIVTPAWKEYVERYSRAGHGR